jgi:hypothetical protein
MSADASESRDDWRLKAELEVADTSGTLRTILGRLRGSDADVIKEIEATVPRDVVVTHDGARLFAYAADEATLREARRAIEAALAQEAIAASIRVSRWDDDLDEWLQTDPPLDAAQRLQADASRKAAETVETRTLVASSGRLIRGELEQTMSGWAQRLGLRCEIVEHPHLLSTQIAFTVTGPRRKIDEFSRGLTTEEWATIRTETAVMASPL